MRCEVRGEVLAMRRSELWGGTTQSVPALAQEFVKSLDVNQQSVKGSSGGEAAILRPAII